MQYTDFSRAFFTAPMSYGFTAHGHEQPHYAKQRGTAFHAPTGIPIITTQMFVGISWTEFFFLNQIKNVGRNLIYSFSLLAPEFGI
jgi:hypothetical protein